MLPAKAAFGPPFKHTCAACGRSSCATPPTARSGSRALWLTRAGQRLSFHTVLKRVRGHGDRLALSVAVTPHTFRRSCTTELIRGGANLWYVKELLGLEHLDSS